MTPEEFKAKQDKYLKSLCLLKDMPAKRKVVLSQEACSLLELDMSGEFHVGVVADDGTSASMGPTLFSAGDRTRYKPHAVNNLPLAFRAVASQQRLVRVSYTLTFAKSYILITYSRESSRPFSRHLTARNTKKAKNHNTIGLVNSGCSRGSPQYSRDSRPRLSTGPRLAKSTRSTPGFTMSQSFDISSCLSICDSSQRNTEYCIESPAPFIILCTFRSLAESQMS